MLANFQLLKVRVTRLLVLNATRLLPFAVAGLLVPISLDIQSAFAANPLDPSVITKYVDPLPIPEVMPSVGKAKGGSTLYEVGMTQFQQQILPTGFPATTVWGYGPPNGNGGYDSSYPARTIEVRKNRKIQVKWINALPANHLLPVDTTISGANTTPAVRTVVHLHGGHTEEMSDGHPEAWFTSNFAVTGPAFKRKVYEYSNRQLPATLWYHDHAHGITRLNVYAGLVGFYLIRDSSEDNLNLPSGKFEIPIMIQDKSFNDDGSLSYPADESNGVTPSIVPEFFGNTAVVNGKVWPKLEVEPRKYRIRFLNGSNARFYNMQLFVDGDLNTPGPVFNQIGTDGGLLEAPVVINGRLLLAPAERADVIIDFSGFEGESLILHSNAKSPFKGLDTINDPSVDDEAPLSEIMQFVVKDSVSAPDTSSLPSNLQPLNRLPEKSARKTRNLTLNEGEDEFGRLMLLINNSLWSDPVTERPVLGTNEIWNIMNQTEDVHPIHLHLVQFQILDRQALKSDGNGGWLPEPDPNAPRVPPDANEDGQKDTVRANPGEITRIIAKFDMPGWYIYHCHILEHEDHEMMRPFRVVERK